MRESAIEKKVNDFAKANGIISLKLEAGRFSSGKPDRQFLYNGKVLFIEFKAPGKKPTELQAKWQEKLTASGFICRWTDNPGEAIQWLREELLR